MSTGIEWTEETWNPTTGCDRVSPGCDHCYALTMAGRLKAMGQVKYQTDGDPRTSGPGFGLAMHDDALEVPLRWRKPRVVFVNSMSDLFHPKVTDEFIVRVFAAMAVSQRHTFQVLTKRPKRMRALLSDADFPKEIAWAAYKAVWKPDAPSGWPLPNVWLGTSVEDEQRADERIPALLDTPAAVRFLSCEPLLGPVRLDHDWLGPRWIGSHVNWVITGGESGPGARPMHPDWVRDLRNACLGTGVPFFFKQWGAWEPVAEVVGDATHVVEPDGRLVLYRSGSEDAYPIHKVGKKAAGRELDGRTWDEMPARAEVPA